MGAGSPRSWRASSNGFEVALDSTASVITVNHPLIQCNPTATEPAGLSEVAVNFYPVFFADYFLDVTYVSGPGVFFLNAQAACFGVGASSLCVEGFVSPGQTFQVIPPLAGVGGAGATWLFAARPRRRPRNRSHLEQPLKVLEPRCRGGDIWR